MDGRLTVNSLLHIRAPDFKPDSHYLQSNLILVHTEIDI